MKRKLATVSLLAAVLSLSLFSGTSFAAVDEYETHSSTVTSTSQVTGKFIRALTGWTYGGTLGGTMSYSQTVTSGWSVSLSCSWDYRPAVAGSLGISTSYSVSVSGGCSYPVPAYQYGRIVQKSNGHNDRLRVTHYVWQNLQPSPPAGVSADGGTVVVPCATLVRIYETTPTAWVPTVTYYASEYSLNP